VFLLVVALSVACLVTVGAEQQAQPEGEAAEGDLDAVDLLEGIVGEDELPDEEDHNEDDYGHYDDGVDEDADEHFRKEEEAFFKNHDSNGDGNLSLEEYKQLLKSEMHGEDIPDGDAPQDDELEDMERTQGLFDDEDTNKDGLISLAEWMSSFHTGAQDADYHDGEEVEDDLEKLSEEEIAEIRREAEGEFKSSDIDGDGKLTLEEIVKLVVDDVNADEEHDIDKNELMEMAKSIFEEMDRNNDTVVEFEEFLQSHMQEPDAFDDEMDEDYYGPEHHEELDDEDEDEHDLDPEDDGDEGEEFDIESLADDRDIDDHTVE